MPSQLTSIIELRMATADAARLVRFYTALGFVVERTTVIASGEIGLLGLSGSGLRTTLRLGTERIVLDQFDRPGRPYPVDSEATDLHFQHFAVVTSDIAAAWQLARSNGATLISDAGPITLPASSGGVTAVKFRDPEGHPVEFLQFPASDSGRWTGRGILGIDHTAITISDFDRARTFYAGRGLRADSATLNQGPEQAALDGVGAPVVDVVPMRPVGGSPHLELLAYRQPSGRRLARQVHDIASTRTVWRADIDTLIRDPDGHLHQLSR